MTAYNTSQSSSLYSWLDDLSLHRKEVSKEFNYGETIKNNTYAIPYTGVDTVSTPFVANNSPNISTPFLESSVDEALSPACFSPYQTSPFMTQQQHISYHPSTTDVAVGQYIDQNDRTVVKSEPVFTGDPMELLIDKSKASTTSPSPTDNITTPLFVPIGSTGSNENEFLHHHHQQQQQQQQQQQMNVFTPNSHRYHLDHESLDCLCYKDTDVLLFQALEGIIDTTSSYQHQQQKQQSVQEQQYHHINQLDQSKEIPPSDDEQQPSGRQYSSTTVTNETSTNTANKVSSTKVPVNNNNNNKRRRKNSDASFHSTDSESDHKKRRSTKTTRVNQNEKRYGCPICRRKFSRRYNLNTHIRTHNANRIKEFACDICGTAFDRKHDRDRHLGSVHYGNRSYSCNHCSATFCRRDALARHTVKSHSDS